MDIRISGQHFSLGDSLKNHAITRLKEVGEKYFENAISGVVHFSKQSYITTCDINFNEGTGRHIVIKSSAECDDPYSAFDQALAKLEKQLRKYKSKIKNHHFAKISENFIDGTEYVINPYSEEEETGHGPVTIAERAEKIGKYSVAEAVMKMDLENLPALMFKNASNDRINIVYYRKDGNISWVDPRE
ncbi:MAG: ribosome-associated translation inhibitor RaiA [Rickettsiaceae bacterium]|nr:ribosome-associated translation inhibitor RaiA [Rickettsiaceae bacterium]